MFKLKQLAVSTVFALSGCVSLAPEYQSPELPIPQQFSLSHNSLVPISTTYSVIGWRAFFADSQITPVIDKALRNNRDLKMAYLKVQEARVQYQVSEADRYPQVNGSADMRYQGGLQQQSTTSKSYTVGTSAAFELDLFGKLQNLNEADRQRFLASEEAQRAVQIMLIANVSQSYFNQGLALAQLNLAQDMLHNYQQSYAFVEQQLRFGSTNLLAREQARGVIESTRAEIANREGQLAQATHALQLLLGTYEESPRVGLAEKNALSPITLPANLSSTILLQRPDLMEAEHQLRAANADIGAARAAFFPSISLTGDLSTSSTDLVNLFSSSTGMWSFIPKIELPIFNAGRNQANLDLAKVRQQQAIVNYEQKIQSAFKEVADALSLRDSLNQQIISQRRYIESLQITLLRANKLYSGGMSSYIEVLDAERSLFTAQQKLLDLKYAQQVNEVNLFSALGGGWSQ